MTLPAPDLIIFGGAFDPPHKGHIGCIELARKTFPQAKIKVIPSYVPPVAGGGVKKTSASFEDRLEMARLCFQKIDLKNLEISDEEKELPQPNYTFQTLRHLKISKINSRISLLIGQDQLKNFSRWKEPKDILSLSSLLLVHRQGTVTSDICDDIKNLAKDLGLEAQFKDTAKEGVFKDTSKLDALSAFKILESAHFPESSTAIKDAVLKENTLLLKEWLSPEVLNFILNRGLYK